MNDRATRVSALLIAIRDEMEAKQLWGEQSPSAEALASTQPFCVDTLMFSEWIQWLMIPRLQVMIDQQIALPQNSNMHTMAEEALKTLEADTAQLESLIQQLDNALNVRH
ncbi:YqcC family protein [Pontibacterium granulatum]|uniref:YqcC family protein n=1 Tax=Pontibacterium granulatum TaxID=2036029 RepID=UPI00249BFC55|nr:YqcC family protein [Pontibacterium granulatum]MDI3323329.1 YqcC family protein [Pontibacterium granulatum]